MYRLPCVVVLFATLATTILFSLELASSAGLGNSITSPDTEGDVGRETSLALDDDENPVISYHDFTNGDLKVMHCNDGNCAGGDESITSPDTAGDVGLSSSMVLDAGGRPVTGYFVTVSENLKVMHCNDVNCAGGVASCQVV